MRKKYLLTLLVVTSTLFVTESYSQHKTYPITNGVGIMGGLTQFDLQTDNFNTSPGNGWILGLSATGDLPHKWYNISYGMQISENKFSIEASPTSLLSNREEIEYKVFMAQLAMLMHIKIVQTYITLDIGPMLQYNGEMQLTDDNQENYLITNYQGITADEITDISPFNFNGAVGMTFGMGHFKLRGQYIYGFTNMLNKLNDANLNTSGGDGRFKGLQSMFVFSGIISF
ncbi:hypothetical protein [Mangrovimonas aestuarii]|uniref:hypothetical protein n=1 Tax=Mangrovimonas aestuarii TaxID=3018443 RepID=UPI002378615D|nr:hypothetical protein [Mangrovimonas aestuarii]